MSVLMTGGPMDGTVMEVTGATPTKIVLDLPARVGGGGGTAEYDLVEKVYRFAGWREDDDLTDAADYINS